MWGATIQNTATDEIKAEIIILCCCCALCDGSLMDHDKTLGWVQIWPGKGGSPGAQMALVLDFDMGLSGPPSMHLPLVCSMLP